MKTKIAVIALLLLFLPSICIAQEITLQSLLPPLPGQGAKINARYLLKGISQRQDVKIFFQNTEHARQSLLRQLKNLPHSDYELPCGLSAKPESIMDFSLPQLIRAYLILDALRNNDLASQSGKANESYQKDSQYEPGGLGLLEKERVIAQLITSEPFEKTPDFFAGYRMPKKDLARPHIFTFHSHPRFLNAAAPAPSWATEFSDGLEANLLHDIGTALSRAQNNGDSHNLLISDVGDRSINLVYYPAEKIESPKNPDSFQFCYKLKGFRIVNMGIWRY